MDKIYFTWENFDKAVSVLTKKLQQHYKFKQVKRVCGIPRGGFVIAVALSHQLSLPLVLGVNSTTLVVDDISDSGTTLEKWGPLAACTATIHVSLDTKYVPDVWAIRQEKKAWVVYPWEKSGQEE